ncbi:MAG: PAS domain-containing protein [Kiritimatiellales bacterium]|nr:PAS domain-containing protein [Kiritimatiellales bacterium]
MKYYAYELAKKTIQGICRDAADGKYDTREKFMGMLAQNPHIAVQGYNAFGKIFYWNDASIDVYGYREEDAVNSDLIELLLPPGMQPFARDAVQAARKTKRMPAPGPCDLIRVSQEVVTVYSGHVVFFWENNTTPEFYCLDLPLESKPAQR